MMNLHVKMYNKIEYLIANEEYEQAMKETKEILVNNNEDVQAWIFKARINIERGNDNEAIAAIKKCEELDNQDAFIPLLWSQFYIMKTVEDEELSDTFYFEEALKYANKSLDLDNEFFDALITKAQLLFWMGNEGYKELIEQCHKIDKKRAQNFMKYSWINQIPNTHPLIIINQTLIQAEELIKRGLFKEAQTEIEKIIPKEMEKQIKEVLYSMKIECLTCLKEYVDAEKEAEKLIVYSPSYPMGYFHKAVISWNLQKNDEAMIWINKTIECAEEQKMQHPQYYMLKATILKKQGDKRYQEYEKFAERVQKENNKMLKKIKKSLK